MLSTVNNVVRLIFVSEWCDTHVNLFLPINLIGFKSRFSIRVWLMLSSVGRDAIIFYACKMEVWHFSSYFLIKNYVNDDIRPHPTQFSWPSSFVETFDTLKCAIEPRLTRLTHIERHGKKVVCMFNSYETSWIIEVTLTENLELKRMRICTLIHCTVSLALRTETTIGH